MNEGDGFNHGTPGATIYLSEGGSGLGVASVGGTALTSHPAPFVADSNGQVAVDYTASNATTFPASGTDTIMAQDSAKSPRVTGVDFYSYAKPAHYRFSPNPIAPSGSLASNSDVPLTLTITDKFGLPVPGARVFLTFSATSGGGSAVFPNCSFISAGACGFVADITGQLHLDYFTPATLPSSGTDTITAESSITTPTPPIIATDSYTF